MIVEDGFLSSDVLQISKRRKKSFIAAIPFFMLKEIEIQNEREVQGNTCISVKNVKTSILTSIKGKGIMY